MNDLPPEMAHLARALAATNVLWLPFRHDGAGSASPASAVEERRAAYRLSGLTQAGGGSDAARQHLHHEILALRHAGLISFRGRTRAACIRLTGRGHDIAAALTGCHRLDHAWVLLRLIADLSEQTPAWVLEHDIIGRDSLQSSDLVALEMLALPLLEIGFLVSASDANGALGYQITLAGLAALTNGPPDVPDGVPECDLAAAEVYDTVFDQAFIERRALVPESAGHIALRLSCGTWTKRIGSAHAAELRAEFAEVVADD